ncbi:MAG: hypothetical protein ACT4PK_03115 [Gammaproteobacteria bacterium]
MPTAWRTLRELDRALGRPKGTAFRAFRRLEASWREGHDFRVLQPERDAAEIEALRAAGRVYASSRTVILISEGAAARIGP